MKFTFATTTSLSTKILCFGDLAFGMIPLQYDQLLSNILVKEVGQGLNLSSMSASIRHSSQTVPSPQFSAEQIARPYSTGDLQLLKKQDNRINELFGDSVAISKSEDTCRATVWSRSDGSGPTTLGNLWRVVTTVKDYGRDVMNRNASPTPPTPEQAILISRSRQITSPIVFKFLESMKPKVEKGFDYSSYLCSSKISVFTLDEVRQHLKSIAAQYDFETSSQMCWAIPIVIESAHYLDSNHIVVITVKDNLVSFFDSKGLTSDKYELCDYTLKDVCNACSQIFRPGIATRFQENCTTVQWDVNNCGVYAISFVYNTLALGKTLNEFNTEMKQLDDVFTLREFILSQIDTSVIPSPTRSEESDSSSEIQPIDFEDLDL